MFPLQISFKKYYYMIFRIIYIFQKADLAIADLTITYEREQAVDFTMPFMNLGEQAIKKHNLPQIRSIFSPSQA